MGGSLKSLKDMKKLKHVYIGDTDIDNGLDDLPDNCQRIYCDNDQVNKKSIVIAKQLNRYAEENFDKNNRIKKYYNLEEWKENKQSDITASVIPLERLFVIRSNIKKYINKWGTKEELSKLQSPKEFSKYWYVGGIKWIARAGAVTGGILALNDNAIIVGSLAAAFPLMEVVASRIEEKLYDAKEKKWEEFINDSESFLDNYHELLGILEQIKKNELGKVNEVLNDLRTKTREFLEEYDKDGNGIIDISEIVEKRKELGTDLSKEKKEVGGGSQLGDVVLNIKDLEKEVISYRQGEREENEKQEENQLSAAIQVVTNN